MIKTTTDWDTFETTTTTKARTQAELLLTRLDCLVEDIVHYADIADADSDWSPFVVDLYEKWLSGADGMRSILAIQHLLEEEE